MRLVGDSAHCQPRSECDGSKQAELATRSVHSRRCSMTWTRRSFLRRAGFTAGTALGVGSLMQVLGAPALAAPPVVASRAVAAQADALAAAKALIAASTAPVASWDGPTNGPAAQPGKFIVYPSQDQRNGGALGVGNGVEEA